MKSARASMDIDPDTLPRMPGWIAAVPAEGLEEAAFLSGAALSYLHLLVSCQAVPQTLWRDRLALRAAEASVALLGRVERAGGLRDAVHLLRPGDHPGPAGAVYQHWRRATERPLSVGALNRALPGMAEAQISGCLAMGQGGAVAAAVRVAEAVLAAHPRGEVAALILADAALASALGWGYILPLLAVGLRPRDLRKGGDDLRLACHRALVASAHEAARLAGDLARGAARIRAAAPKLRAKGAALAVEMFLTRDAVAPAALPLPDRAARRLCDRLVDLGAVRELTGRETFRLYGV